MFATDSEKKTWNNTEKKKNHNKNKFSNSYLDTQVVITAVRLRSGVHFALWQHLGTRKKSKTSINKVINTRLLSWFPTLMVSTGPGPFLPSPACRFMSLYLIAVQSAAGAD